MKTTQLFFLSLLPLLGGSGLAADEIGQTPQVTSTPVEDRPRDESLVHADKASRVVSIQPPFDSYSLVMTKISSGKKRMKIDMGKVIGSRCDIPKLQSNCKMENYICGY